MSYILAIESDPRQAAALSHVVKDRVPGAQLTVVDSKDGALASIQKKAPDLILVTALFSPREEEELIAHLRTLEGAEHLQTLTIPLLAASDDDDDGGGRGLFGFKKKKRKKSAEVPTQGCDPVVFAEQIAGYLKTASEMKANAEAAKIAAKRAAQRAAETAAETAAQPVPDPVEVIADLPSDTAFAAPADTVIAADPEPVIPYAAEPVAPAPEPLIAPQPTPAPGPEPAVAQAREHPLVGYSVESTVQPDPPVAESPIFGSVLFAKVKPKREIKPFTEATPVADDRPVVPDLPIVDQIPIVAETPIVAEAQVFVAPPVDAAPPLAVAPPPQPVEMPPQHAEPPQDLEMPRFVERRHVVEPVHVVEPARPVRLVHRLPPLAMWARRLQEGEPIRARDIGPSSNGNSEEGPLAVLRIPPAIATITYPTGCRIRRVIAKSVA